MEIRLSRCLKSPKNLYFKRDKYIIEHTEKESERKKTKMLNIKSSNNVNVSKINAISQELECFHIRNEKQNLFELISTYVITFDIDMIQVLVTYSVPKQNKKSSYAGI